MPLPLPHVLGLVALLGNDSAGRGIHCHYHVSQFLGGTTTQLPDVTGSVLINAVDGTATADATQGSDTLNMFQNFNMNPATPTVGQPCPQTMQEGVSPNNRTYTFAGSDYYEGSASGIYEWALPTLLCGVVAVSIALYFSGMAWMKRAIGAVTEDTNEDDTVVWDTDENGREYYRPKRRWNSGS